MSKKKDSDAYNKGTGSKGEKKAPGIPSSTHHQRTALFIVLTLAAILLSIKICTYFSFRYPQVLPAHLVPEDQFSEERAKEHTRYLVENIGMREFSVHLCDIEIEIENK